MIQILTTRFNSKTIEENKQWKKRKKINTCGYGLTTKIPESIPVGSYTYVIEMINDVENPDLGVNVINKIKKGKIAGIGYIKNKYYPDNRSRIYGDHNYNRYVYIGENYITRDEIINKFGNEIVIYLETILFTGSRHFKRGQGMTKLSLHRIAIQNNIKSVTDICKICGLLKSHETCKGYRVKPIPKKNQCPFCFKSKRTRGGVAHVCKAIQRDETQLKKVLTFFRNLFN